ncbi:histidine phosphatase superfamily [Lasiosphaeria miniovina]|uniref:Histidine phosphatase superfamily n=1 Tax=Lasiosphaeria miniovina TaxID=1954250 RepID=A0AA40DK26_9PEZI|nr:histidine phosphatase superfamily [Lasiosphaeria miniovina]KAK0706055.1 histidine phosphatase superfamily [Lasiosphaeria miniovina]
MRLFFIRHGETVHNVAGLYAGVCDSQLTAHGVLQAQRLGAHLAARSASVGPVVRIFSSDLQRAAITAQAIIDAQTPNRSSGSGAGGGYSYGIPDQERAVRLVKLPDLRERDFRSAEGKPYGTPRTDAETHQEMAARSDRFVRTHLAPVLCDRNLLESPTEVSVMVVAHGLILNFLLRSLLSRFAPAELAQLEGPGTEYLSAWGNTGYMEATVGLAPQDPTVVPTGVDSKFEDAVSTISTTRPKRRIKLNVLRLNSLDHLDGLKKTRGGIGSAQFDKNQKTLDSFVRPSPKKRKLGE